MHIGITLTGGLVVNAYTNMLQLYNPLISSLVEIAETARKEGLVRDLNPGPLAP